MFVRATTSRPNHWQTRVSARACRLQARARPRRAPRSDHALRPRQRRRWVLRFRCSLGSSPLGCAAGGRRRALRRPWQAAKPLRRSCLLPSLPHPPGPGPLRSRGFGHPPQLLCRLLTGGRGAARRSGGCRLRCPRAGDRPRRRSFPLQGGGAWFHRVRLLCRRRLRRRRRRLRLSPPRPSPPSPPPPSTCGGHFTPPSAGCPTRSSGDQGDAEIEAQGDQQPNWVANGVCIEGSLWAIGGLRGGGGRRGASPAVMLCGDQTERCEMFARFPLQAF